jgi:cysteine desulfurase
MHENYFDNAATTPVDPRVVAEMLPYLTDFPDNAASIHQYGQQARKAIKLARERCANLVGAEDPLQITFCSGSSEANNWVLANFDPAKVAVSAFEHPSILRRAVRDGMTILPPFHHEQPTGFDLLALMWINNEVGTIFDFEAIRARVQAQKVLVDGTQGIGKVPFSPGNADYVSVSAHKFYGPKGIGFLYQRDIDLKPLLMGGGQEYSRRGGTVNVSGAVAMGMAAQLAIDEIPTRFEHASRLNAAAREALAKISDVHINSSLDGSPYVLSVSFAGITGETLLIDMDRQGYCLSAGSACSSGSGEASSALVAFGVPSNCISGTIRMSFGQFNTVESTVAMVTAMAASVQKIRSLR